MRSVDEIKDELHRAYGTEGGNIDKLQSELLCALLDGISIDRLEEICNAEKDGRCVILPCKVGDDIFWISEENTVEVHKRGVRGVLFTKNGFQIQDTDGGLDLPGTRYCYLTRAEAEKALEGQG